MNDQPLRRGLTLVGALALLTTTAIADDGHGGTVIYRINCAGKEYVDQAGNVWIEDDFYTGGKKGSTQASIEGTVDDLLFQKERYGDPFSYALPVADGSYEITLHFAELYFKAEGKRVFNIDVEGQRLVEDLDVFKEVRDLRAHSIRLVQSVDDGVLDLDFGATKNNAQLCAIEVAEHDSDHPFLHVVIRGPEWTADYRNRGEVDVTLEGRDSHTHEFGRELTDFTWEWNGNVIGVAEDVRVSLPIGRHEISLTIGDDNVPQETLQDSFFVDVFPIDAVGGAVVAYHNLESKMGLQRGFVDYMDVQPDLSLSATSGRIGASHLSKSRVHFYTRIDVPVAADYEFQTIGDTLGRVRVNGQRVRGRVNLPAGRHDLEWRVIARELSDLPAELHVAINGGAFAPIDINTLTHDQTNLPPFLNPIPPRGSAFGGEQIELPGLGFFPERLVLLQFGDDLFVEPTIDIEPTLITATTPAGEGTVEVQVRSPNGMSNRRTFLYDRTAPIQFEQRIIANLDKPTVTVWGPDHRLYVGTLTGHIHIFSFDDDYNVTDEQVVTTIANDPAPFLLGMTFDPNAPPGEVHLLVGHCLLYEKGGDCFEGSSWYSGQVKLLVGPDFDQPVDLVNRLPVSNHDHGINTMFFDEFGDLYVCVGGQTNAGILDCNMGGLPESPLSGSLVRVRLTDPAFDGLLRYEETDTGVMNNDQVFGDIVDIEAGHHVEPWALGFRNAFTAIFTTRGEIFLAENGANAGFGASAVGEGQDPDPTAPDEILRIAENAYYGHPNLNRGREDIRQQYYRHPEDEPILGGYVGPIVTAAAAITGMTEYRATTFGDRMYGNVLYQKWNGPVWNGELDVERFGFETNESLPDHPSGLTLLHAPGGALIGADYTSNRVTVAIPVDASAVEMVAYDIFPWRAPAAGGQTFMIGGDRFPPSAQLQVLIGGVPAQITETETRRIMGVIPPRANPTADLLDVVVRNTASGEEKVIPGGFRYLLNPLQGQGAWMDREALPRPLGEVAGAVIRNVEYLVAEDYANTMAYDFATGEWFEGLESRPFIGQEHAAESIDGKLYLFGGLGSGSEGRVQIYDPELDFWNEGARMPFLVGATSTAVIGGKVYVAGGILDSDTTTDQAAMYDPKTDTWTPLAPMPVGRNQAASGTDGQRLFVFGGRGAGSGDGDWVAEGFDDVQIYNPATDQWDWSGDGVSGLAPLPVGRGGMGRAAWFKDEFYIIGGNTTDGTVPDGVYDRVDVYHAETNTWRAEAPLSKGLHGIDPVVHDRLLFIAGGGAAADDSESDAVMTFHR